MVKMTERQLAAWWRQQLPYRAEMATEGGEPIRIIYPGRTNDDQGADLRDAVIATKRGLLMGDIELHVRSSDWQAHHHHLNPAYNRVILHVVIWHDSDTPARRQDGKCLPVLAVHRYLETPPPQLREGEDPASGCSLPCLDAAERLTPHTIAAILDKAGRERFLFHVARFQAELSQTEAGEVLYRGIMGALGYRKNRQPFIELARRVPLHVLESAITDGMSDREYLSRQQAILLAAAGLRPDNGGATSPCPTPTMSPGAWHRFKVRPNNSPQRRIMAMSYLLLRYRQNGVLASLLEKIIQAPISQGHIFLEHGLTVTTGGSRPFTFLGRDRAADIIVNALLPFAFAYGKVNLYPQLMRKSLALYGTYPRLVANAIERHMKEQLGVSEDVVNSARRQQGLLHIYQTRCTRGKCCACFFGTQASLREATTSMSRPSTLAALRRK